MQDGDVLDHWTFPSINLETLELSNTPDSIRNLQHFIDPNLTSNNLTSWFFIQLSLAKNTRNAPVTWSTGPLYSTHARSLPPCLDSLKAPPRWLAMIFLWLRKTNTKLDLSRFKGSQNWLSCLAAFRFLFWLAFWICLNNYWWAVSTSSSSALPLQKTHTHTLWITLQETNRSIHITPLEKENHLPNHLGREYVSFQEGNKLLSESIMNLSMATTIPLTKTNLLPLRSSHGAERKVPLRKDGLNWKTSCYSMKRGKQMLETLNCYV